MKKRKLKKLIRLLDEITDEEHPHEQRILLMNTLVYVQEFYKKQQEKKDE